ncbi:hypothetical protein ABMA27_002864 [Loxostege sticticalis]|uniref:Carboxylic ester hydrolase n=1 Tax=Loxostege sticticalis TaxID=481309 RepID=A0ABR3HV62_LOXSC
MDYLSLVLLVILAKCNIVELVVVTVNEGQLNGVSLNLSTGLGTYYSFKGIPYAEPPVGKLRFKDPIPHKPWEGVREAVVHGPICAQFNQLLHLYLPGSEDCLFLNVYTPNLNPEKPLSVIFFIHGGGFMSGSGDVLVYGPDFIVQKNVVLVTINYRLDALGFLNLGTKEVPGNAGLKDQSLALKWVHDNIQSFGGNPDEVTIMGESAGSASVIYHMMSPMSKGLFIRSIALSGVPFCEWAITFELTKRSFELGKSLGKNTNDPEEMLEFLQSLPALKVIHKFPIVIPEEKNWNYGFKMTAFQPAPENDFGQERFLVETPIETLKRGNITPADLLIGYTSNEALILLLEVLSSEILENNNNMRELLIPREVLLYGTGSSNKEALSEKIHKQYFGDSAIDLNTVDRFIKYMTDEIFVYNVNRLIRHLPTGLKKYLYKFFCISDINRFSPLGDKFGIDGVAHSDDLGYVFDSRVPSSGRYPVDVTSRTYKLIDQTITLYTNFAKYGNPTPVDSLGAIWPEYDDISRSYMIINDTLAIGNDVDADVYDFWKQIYDEGGAELT